MAVPASLRKKLATKLERQIDLEIKRLEEELAAPPVPWWRKTVAAVFKGLLSQVPLLTAIGVVATLYLGVLSYQKDLREKRDARFFSLIDILQKNSGLDNKTKQDAVTAAIGAIRTGYARDREYAFSTAFFVMPYAALKAADYNSLRRIASQTLAEAVGSIYDYPEFQTIFSKWNDVVSSSSASNSSEYLNDTGRVVCALGGTIKRFGFPGPDDQRDCKRYLPRTAQTPG